MGSQTLRAITNDMSIQIDNMAIDLYCIWSQGSMNTTYGKQLLSQ